MPGPRILIFDIENSALRADVWSLWSEARSMDFVHNDWILLCYCAKWLGSDRVHKRALPSYDLYKKDPKNDRDLAASLWHMLDAADIVVAHNAIRHDVRKSMARFVYHGWPPPSPFKVVDTLKLAKKFFGFSSNRLDDLGAYLGLGRKIDTGGHALWKGVISGDMEDWKLMVKYCARDVTLLESVYLRLAPYCNRLPNVANYVGALLPKCSHCGSSDLTKNGFAYTAVSTFQQYRCKSCGAYSRGRVNVGDRPQTTGVA